MTDATGTTTASAGKPSPATFARLTRYTFCTIESSFKRRTNPQAWRKLETMLLKGLTPNLFQRAFWSDEEWLKFNVVPALRTVMNKSKYDMPALGVPLMVVSEYEEISQPESDLYEAYMAYKELYEKITYGESYENEDKDACAAQAKVVDRLLGQFQASLGDPVAVCAQCHQHALGRPLKRCSRCKQVAYCSTTCQKQHWKAAHKAVCQPPSAPQLDQLIRQRYKILRRQGKEIKPAMEQARREYGQSEDDDKVDVGAQVAAMFGVR